MYNYCAVESNLLGIEQEMAVASHSLGPVTKSSLFWLLLITSRARPDRLVIIEEVGQVIGNEVLSRDTEVQWIPVTELPSHSTVQGERDMYNFTFKYFLFGLTPVTAEECQWRGTLLQRRHSSRPPGSSARACRTGQ